MKRKLEILDKAQTDERLTPEQRAQAKKLADQGRQIEKRRDRFMSKLTASPKAMDALNRAIDRLADIENDPKERTRLRRLAKADVSHEGEKIEVQSKTVDANRSSSDKDQDEDCPSPL